MKIVREYSLLFLFFWGSESVSCPETMKKEERNRTGKNTAAELHHRLKLPV
jgi:hypothetical protein